ncbi:hypothetical protein B0H13DRAFT_2003110 [Mycena leptocephala]|nr:hypothetical protein B0H13DRAFT_2003110 [Mycena leptocephala]
MPSWSGSSRGGRPIVSLGMRGPGCFASCSCSANGNAGASASPCMQTSILSARTASPTSLNACALSGWCGTPLGRPQSTPRGAGAAFRPHPHPPPPPPPRPGCRRPTAPRSFVDALNNPAVLRTRGVAVCLIRIDSGWEGSENKGQEDELGYPWHPVRSPVRRRRREGESSEEKRATLNMRIEDRLWRFQVCTGNHLRLEVPVKTMARV